jgi:hypothetical protein
MVPAVPAEPEPAPLAEPPLVIWAHDDALIAAAIAAADRIYLASGVVVLINPADVPLSGLPMFWSTAGADTWYGHYRNDGAHEWIAIDQHTPAAVLATVVLHALGAGHVGAADSSGYLMSPRTTTPQPIRSEDLAELCAVRPDCTRFAPEAGP